MAKRETLQVEDACMLMHTAMRKICDSKITSCMYNLVHLICAANLNEDLDVWLIFGGEVAANINAGMAPTTATSRPQRDNGCTRSHRRSIASMTWIGLPWVRF